MARVWEELGHQVGLLVRDFDHRFCGRQFEIVLFVVNEEENYFSEALFFLRQSIA